jgi:formate--tetrahydrofolate ligase
VTLTADAVAIESHPTAETDIEIAARAQVRPITEIAAELGLAADEIELYGWDKAKIPLPSIANRGFRKWSKLVLVTSVNPTPAGEGKSTIMIGLADALQQFLPHVDAMWSGVAIAMREPSLGPVFGIKGGATGGGHAQVVPMVDINLNFTGDLHALTSATNLIASFVDNHLQHGNALNIDTRKIVWKRALDLNDRALREVVVGLGGRLNGVPREDGFDITAASELMGVLVMSQSYADLKARIGRMVVAYDTAGDPVTVDDIGITGAAAALLRDALKPNLVQTLEGTPVIMHGGPFANISIGCNSVLATRAALSLADFALTEAGFGADLGAEKFLDILVPQIGKAPDIIVVVVTLRSIKMHGGVAKSDLAATNRAAVEAGFANAKRHIENMQQYGVPVVVAVNRFASDDPDELALLERLAAEVGAPVAMADVHTQGGAGGIALAQTVIDALYPGIFRGRVEESPHNFQPLYSPDDSLETKIYAVVKKIYHGSGVNYTPRARKQLAEFEKRGWGSLPVCIAKTQYSFSDNPKALGAPTGFEITVQELIPKIGAGFIVVRTGDIVTMPGLPKHPAGLNITLSDDGEIDGVI